MKHFLKSPKFFLLLGVLFFSILILSRGRNVYPDATRKRFDLVMQIIERNISCFDPGHIGGKSQTPGPTERQ